VLADQLEGLTTTAIGDGSGGILLADGGQPSESQPMNDGIGVADPTSMDATVRRLMHASEDPVVDKYLHMGYKRDAVVLGETPGCRVWGVGCKV